MARAPHGYWKRSDFSDQVIAEMLGIPFRWEIGYLVSAQALKKICKFRNDKYTVKKRGSAVGAQGLEPTNLTDVNRALASSLT
jgi:hypothetical protein